MEASKVKYATELDSALKQYADLQEQTDEFEPIELCRARQTTCPDYERDAAQRVQDTYNEKV